MKAVLTLKPWMVENSGRDLLKLLFKRTHVAIRGFGDRFVEPPVDLQDSSRVRHLHKLNLTLEGGTGALVSDKGLLLLRLPLELGFQQVATPGF